MRIRLVLAAAIGCAALAWAVLPVARALEEKNIKVEERDPALGAKAPDGVVWESKKGWKFEKDKLVFFNENQNKNGNRYVVWHEYHFEISDAHVTIYDTRPYGSSMRASRQQVDEQSRPLSDKKVLDELKDQAEDIRQAREPRPVVIYAYPPYYYQGPFWFEWRFHHGYCR